MKQTRFITQAAVIAALYVALTHLSNLAGLANGAIQLRLSEALTILPFFMPSAVVGVPLGCLIANITTGCVIWDVIFGTFASLLGAVFTYFIGKHRMKYSEYLAPVPPILANTLIIPFVLRFADGVPDALWYRCITLFIGEFLSCGVLGVLFYKLLKKTGFVAAAEKGRDKSRSENVHA